MYMLSKNSLLWQPTNIFYKTMTLPSDWHPLFKFPWRPTTHAKVNALGLSTTLWSGWITVDVQNEYIYSYMRTAIITSVCLEDKADFMWLCLRGNTWNLQCDQKETIFLIHFQLESTPAEIIFVAKWIWKESMKSMIYTHNGGFVLWQSLLRFFFKDDNFATSRKDKY